MPQNYVPIFIFMAVIGVLRRGSWVVEPGLTG